jgi:membrane protein DedA with SNARE-associated domain
MPEPDQPPSVDPADGAKPPGYTRAWLAGFGGVMGARALGLALLPALLVQAPVVLLLLSPMLAHLILAGPVLGPWRYFAAALTSSILQGAIAYHFGLALGDKARMWLEGRGAATHAATTRMLRWMERAAPAVLLAFAGPPICALAGVSRVRMAVFYPVMIIAQVIWIGACFLFGTAVTEQIEQVHTFAETHLIELSALALAWVGGSWLWKRHRRRQKAQLE